MRQNHKRSLSCVNCSAQLQPTHSEDVNQIVAQHRRELLRTAGEVGPTARTGEKPATRSSVEEPGGGARWSSLNFMNSGRRRTAVNYDELLLQSLLRDVRLCQHLQQERNGGVTAEYFINVAAYALKHLLCEVSVVQFSFSSLYFIRVLNSLHLIICKEHVYRLITRPIICYSMLNV